MFKAATITVAGLATTLLTVIIVGLLGHFTGFHIFSFSLFFVLPVGAALCGAAAASGLYLASLYYHVRPGLWMLVPLVIFGVVANVSIYYLEYRLARFDDGALISSVATFTEYLDVSITHQVIRIGRGAREAGEVGQAGYWLALLDLIGFVTGSAWVFFALRSAQACLKCQKYLRPQGSRQRYFSSAEEADAYLNTVLTQPVGSDEYESVARAGRQSFIEGQTPLTVHTELFSCEGCQNQLWLDRPSVWNGKNWIEIPAAAQRIVADPDVNLARFVKRKGMLSLLG